MQKEEYNITHINLFRVDQPLIKPYKLSYKENVAVGRIIPAGTGTPKISDVLVGVDRNSESSMDVDDAVA